MAVLTEDFEGGTDGLGVTNVNTGLDAVSSYSGDYDPAWSGAQFTATDPHGGTLCITGKTASNERFEHPYQDDGSQNITDDLIDDFWWHKWSAGTPEVGTEYHYKLTTGQIGEERTSGYDYEPLTLYYNSITGWVLHVATPEPGGTPAGADYPIALPEDAWNKFHVTSNASGDLTFTVTDAADAEVFTWTEAGFLENLTHFEGPQRLAFHTWRVFNSDHAQTWLDDINVATVPEEPEPEPLPEEEVAEVYALGPDNNIHRTRFAIPQRRTVSAQVQVAIGNKADHWIHPWVIFWTWNDGDWIQTDKVPVSRPVPLGSEWQQIAFVAQAPEGATHWTPVLRYCDGDPRIDGYVMPQPGAYFYYDCAFFPDNGEDVSAEPYLDGDQPGAIWEGPKGMSTSIYSNVQPTIRVLGDGLVLEGIS